MFHEKNLKTNERGIIYILTHPSMPNIIRIGRTSASDVKTRLDDLNRLMAVPFECIYSTIVDNYVKVERYLIESFMGNQVGIGEYFEVDVSKAIELIKLIEKPPAIIKTVDYFDPTIYQMIKKNPELLKTMDWRVFEEMLADILRRLNYSVELTKQTRDGGVDIIAIKKDENFGSHKYLLQAKRYNNKVQVQPVRELLFLHSDLKATKSCLVTTSSFTKGAWELAEINKWKLELKDQKGILNWIDKILPSTKK